MTKSSEKLAPSEQLKQAHSSLKQIWRRWNKETDALKRERLWGWVQEAEIRLLQAKRVAGLLVDGVCPKCASTSLFVFNADDGLKRNICKKCGWADSDDLQAIIRKTANRIKRRV